MGRFLSTGCVPRKRLAVSLLVAAAIGVLGAQLAAATPALAAPVLQPCAPSFIGVPGSGESDTHSPTMAGVEARVKTDAAAAGQQLRNSTLLPYLAVPVSNYVEPYGVNWNNLGKSEASGESNLTALINAYRSAAAAAGCPNAPILLAGYSQGAEVVIRTVDALPQAVRDTISIALLGDPSFTAEVTGDLDFNSDGHNGIRPSLLLGQRYTLKSDVIKRTIDICAATDPICSFSASKLPGLLNGTSAHFKYPTLTYQGHTLVAYAGDFIWTNRWNASTVTIPPPAPGVGRILISPCLNLRAGPNGNTALIGCIPVNTSISIDCTASGNAVTGPYGTETLWDHTSYDGASGYVADAWVYTGTNGPVAGSCSLPAPPPPAPTGYEAGRQVSVVSQATGGVSGHTGPANSYAAGPTHPANSALWIVCYVNGQSITGPYGTETAWDLGDDGYYYSDAWIWTGSNSAVVPPCSLKGVAVVSQATGGDSGHAGPSNAYAAGPTHPAGATIQIACYVDGQAIAGPYATETIWDLSTDGYYYADAWLWTDSNCAVVPRC